MSQQYPDHPADASGAYPDELPGPGSGVASPAAAMPDIHTSHDQDWHQAGTLGPGPDEFGTIPESGPPPAWPAEGVFMPAGDNGPPTWDDSSSGTQLYRTPRDHNSIRRLPARLIATAALVLLGATAITVVVVPRNHTIRISPADDPATASQQTPSIQSTAQPEPPAVTKAAAERILARYWQVNNEANQARSGTVLKTIESGSSYSIDAGSYEIGRVTDPSNNQYVPFTAENATYYIPREPSGVYPRWFAARVTYADLATPQHATGGGYVLFTQAAMNAPWKNVLEPYLLAGNGPGPFVATDAHGYTNAANVSGETGLSVTSGQLQDLTAKSLDGTATTIKNPGNLADLRDQVYFAGKLPAGSTDTDKHSAPGLIFALKTIGGGVLAFYHLSAQLTLAPPPGQTFQVGIPGFYSSSQTLTSATIEYAEQFAAYIPPDKASPRILADASGITGRG